MPQNSYGHAEYVEGSYSITANQVEIVSRTPIPPGIPGTNVITLLAAGMGMDGLVDVRGSQGVRISAGPPPALAAGGSSTNGVEIEIGQTGTFKLQRGLVPPAAQTMEMTTDAITIDAGVGKVTIKSLTEI